MYIQEQRNGNLLLTGMNDEERELMKEVLVDLCDFVCDEPEYPELINWSDQVPMTRINEVIPTEYIRSGVYKIYHNNHVIYIGETRCDGTVVSRKGMWSRRSDFRSTVQSDGKVKNPYGNALKFLELYGKEELNNVSHAFHHVHPKYCKEAELQLLKEYHAQHEVLPALQSGIDYKRIKVKCTNTK